ncbi:hypothetical protein Tco_1057943 [Tanacetum coccineum]|uniref:Uncharacterized protein n=1 Tax=Tanacetum coccineum TaxID=301880 RepID=A0ABQ5H6T9_9ASTR
MGDENQPRTLGDYSRPSHKGYRNTIELLEGDNVVPLRSDTIRLVMDSFQGVKKFPHHGIDLWLQVQIFYDHVIQSAMQAIDYSASGKLRDKSTEESWELIEDLALYDNEKSRLSSLGTQLKHQQDEVINKLNTLWKIVSGKFNNAPTYDIAKNSMVHTNVVSIDHQDSEALPNKGIIKTASKLFSPKYQAQSSLGEENRNSSSLKRVHFVNTITIVRKEDEPKETEILEFCAIDGDDHNLVVEAKKTIKKEPKVSNIIEEEGESSNTWKDDKASNLEDEACKHKSKVGEEGE